MRAGRRREDRRGAVGAVRPVGPGRPPPRLLAGTPGRPHLIDPLGGPVRFVPFELERWQSTWEHRVRFNLSESGVHPDRKSTRLNSSHPSISYAVFCLKKKKKKNNTLSNPTQLRCRKINQRNHS